MNNNQKFGNHPLVELTKARFLEFIRDHSALFWVFIFPIFLTVVLGIAFRNRGPETIEVGFMGPAAPELVTRIQAQKPAANLQELKITLMELERAGPALRSGKIDLIVKAEPGASGLPAVIYRYDPTRPGARMARVTVDNLIQISYGRIDNIRVVEEKVEEKGGRYIDFLIPGIDSKYNVSLIERQSSSAIKMALWRFPVICIGS